ncbi:aspartyl-phosphate phosphatase Spo0E family protein [Paenibacillus sp. MMS20-IR301]|uniref:aspartyl-phosphate phosphatase Spo0E family protein n=1 Tax=Paenibacillus sp. MMS20-IR301 TaxID=2895946 RepID=UPI0028E6E9A4|nr:aspartyl-phosphate phosphatase Spo0E family protein [Paenibacillus sp. MMS20-IR301]WNS42596.1 aspartyl-phosphate phosphatase Spo0E family protein [Paenibacillus sp. MMS20-IR301]
MYNPASVRIRIERARSRLHQLQTRHGGFGHPEVLRQSVVLDELLNTYDNVYRIKKRPPA